MSDVENIVYNLSEIEIISKRIMQKVHGRILCFSGEIGSGKTTLIKQIVKDLGGLNVVTSPTFNIVNLYHDKSEKLIAYHIDLYRIEDPVEIFEFGLDEIIHESKAWVLIEWPNMIKSSLPENHTEIIMNVVNDIERSIKIV